MKYDIDIDKITTQAGYITVEAENEVDANQLAYDAAERGEITWGQPTQELDIWNIEDANPVPWSKRGRKS